MTKVAILGFGNRGQMFGKLIQEDESVELVAVAEVVKASRDLALELGVKPEMLFESADFFMNREKSVTLYSSVRRMPSILI